MKTYVAFVSGGETTSLIGNFSSIGNVDRAIKNVCDEARMGEWLICTEVPSSEHSHVTHRFLHEEGEEATERWELMFTIVQLNMDEQVEDALF